MRMRNIRPPILTFGSMLGKINIFYTLGIKFSLTLVREIPYY